MINTINTGLEEFEEKIDKIAEGEDDGENSWISKIYNQFSFFNDGENTLEENDMDGLEPPLLDETWGLGLRTHNKGGCSIGWCWFDIQRKASSRAISSLLVIKR